MAQILLTDIRQLMTLNGAFLKKAKGSMSVQDLGIKKNQAIVIENGKIKWLGGHQKIPKEFYKIKKSYSLNANVFPGFIDCHTHSLFAGDRTHEFELRILGKTYQEIANQGGGILHTVRETRRASREQLESLLSRRMDVFLKQGVTTVEVKSGYGLSLKDEVRLLEILKLFKKKQTIVPTFLGAHAKPSEFSSNQEYLSEMLEALKIVQQKNLSRRVDIFIEKNYFSVKEGEEYLTKAQNMGFDITIHADQMSRTQATLLAKKLSAKSADHVICLNQNDILEVSKSDLTAVLLPTADFYIRCPYPPARKLIDSGCRVALATDFNPGTSPTQNIQWVGLLARQEMKMTLPEVFVAFTLAGAYALGMQDHKGGLRKNFDADFFVSEVDWEAFFYDLNPISITKVGCLGKIFPLQKV